MQCPDITQFMPLDFRADESFMLPILKTSGRSLAHAGHRLRTSPSVVKVAALQDWEALRYAPYSFLADPEFMILILGRHGIALCLTPLILRCQLALVEVAVQQ